MLVIAKVVGEVAEDLEEDGSEQGEREHRPAEPVRWPGVVREES